MSTLKTIIIITVLLMSCLHLLSTVEGNNKSSQYSKSKNFRPWSHDPNSPCFPFWPFSCTQVNSPPPPQPLPPTLPPSAVPPTQPTALPAIPANLVFADKRLAAVYPVIQRFKSIITFDPLGISATWTGPDICNYKGFFCDHPPYNATAITVASVDFNGYNLGAPTLMGFLDKLPDLALFHANSNRFAGTLNLDLTNNNLPYLYELDLSNNLLSGDFPLAVAGLNSLSFLDIRFNLFSGSVPPSIFSQDNLNVLFLNDNAFLSTLPYNLQNTHILYLTLANNKFTGPIPNDISKALSALTEILLLNNELTGCLPYELGLLDQVTVFDVSNNKLTGPLPLSLACMERVQLLDFSGNLLYGMVPDLICRLPNLANLTLAGNYFTQIGPACRELVRQGIMDVRDNCVPGLPFQRSLIECSSFFAIPRMCPFMNTYNILPCKPLFH